MKTFRIFEDSAPFSLVIKQSVQGNTCSEQQPFHWGARFHIGHMGLGGNNLEPRTNCDDKALEVTSALWSMEQESGCFGTLSETR